MIPYDQLPGFGPLFLDYIAGRDSACGLFSGQPWDHTCWESRIAAVQKTEDRRTGLVDVLLRQNTRLENDSVALENIERLRSRETVAVVTGQQVGVLTGPLYTIYKALTTVKLCRWVRDTWNVSAVPVFWMETGDHDFAEIASAHVIGRDNLPVSITYERLHPDATHSVSDLRIHPGVNAMFDRFAKLLPETEFTPGMLDDLRAAYPPGGTFAAGFGRLLLRLMQGTGLVLVDPSDPEIKSLCKGFFHTVLDRQTDYQHALESQTAAVANAGYTPQVQIPSDSFHLFCSGAEGRQRLDRRGDSAVLGERVLDHDAVTQMVEDTPDIFSPNVMTRPLMQDWLLPTIAYVAGPGETAYLAQLRTAYAVFGLPMPVVYPRASATIVPAAVRKILNKQSLAIPDVVREKDGGLSRLVRERHGGALQKRISESGGNIDREFANLEQLAGEIDSTLLNAVANARKKVSHQLSSLEGKMGRALEQQQATLATQIQRCRAMFCPADVLQERHLNVFSFIDRYGYAFIDRLTEQLDPHARQHQIIDL